MTYHWPLYCGWNYWWRHNLDRGLLTAPTLLVCVDATAHARARCRKGSSSHNNSSVARVATEPAG